MGVVIAIVKWGSEGRFTNKYCIRINALLMNFGKFCFWHYLVFAKYIEAITRLSLSFSLTSLQKILIDDILQSFKHAKRVGF